MTWEYIIEFIYQVYLVWEDNQGNHIKKGFMIVTDWFCENCMT